MKAKWFTCVVILVFNPLFAPVALAEAPNGLTAEAISAYYNSEGINPSNSMGYIPPASANVEVVVNNSLYAGGLITAGLNQYLQNIRNQGYNPILTTTNFAGESALRTHLANRHNSQGLAGAVFIGDLPVANYEIAAHGSWKYEDFPCDLYFQDMDGTWGDSDSNGKYDSHTGDVAPEIWVGRLLTHTLTGLHPNRTEAGMLNDYFARNNAYRTSQLSLSNNGLAYVDDDWQGSASTWGNDMGAALGGTVTIVSDGATTVATDYKNRLQTEYEHVLLCAHSNSSLHRFKIGSAWTGGDVNNSDLEAVDPQVFFYNLFACSNADYTAGGYMAGEYVFGTDLGLLSVGSSKTGSMLHFGDYFDPLGEGEIFGEAWKNWWLARAASGFNDYEKDWHYGMTMIGDPLLLTQEFIPEPTTLSLLVLGGLALIRRRRK